jgi:hypothetical protein
MNIARRGSCLLLGSLTLLAACDRAPEPGFDVSVPWALTGTTLTLDTHTHTRFSDGELTPDELARLAVDHGCDALAITDHSDHAVAAATPAYFDAVDEVRRQHPGLTVFAGLEWNVPPYDGREHVTVLVEPALERSVLPAFKELHDGMEDQADATKALQWLAGQASSARGEVVLFYNHPSRKDEDAGENERDLAQWRQVNDLLAGFEGGPGHQRSVTPGAYRQTIKPVDRWDPVVAEPGGGWDRLLDAGHDVWGALASSDYHERRNDYAPCRFARTTVTVDKDDARGILRALRAGSFWAGHGGVLSELWFILVEPALPLPATPGETVRLPAAAQPVLRVKLARGPRHLGLPLTVEIIGNGLRGRPELVASGSVAPDADSFDFQPSRLVPGGDGRSAYFRARVIADDPARGRLVAYTNPIRVVLMP